MELNYLIMSVVLTSIAAVGVGFIVINHYGNRWFNAWIDELDLFQSDREKMLREIKLEFLKELIDMTRVASDIALRSSEGFEEKEINKD